MNEELKAVSGIYPYSGTHQFSFSQLQFSVISTSLILQSFLTEVLGNTEECPVDTPADTGYELQPMSVLYEDELEEETPIHINGSKVPCVIHSRAVR